MNIDLSQIYAGKRRFSLILVIIALFISFTTANSAELNTVR